MAQAEANPKDVQGQMPAVMTAALFIGEVHGRSNSSTVRSAQTTQALGLPGANTREGEFGLNYYLHDGLKVKHEGPSARIQRRTARRSAISAPSALCRAKSAKGYGQPRGGHLRTMWLPLSTERCGCHSPRQTNDNHSTTL
jgi:hypothetical protein